MRVLLTGLLLILCVVRPAWATSEQEEILQRAEITLLSIAADPDMRPDLERLLAEARGVMIVPQLVRGGIIIGGEGGTGVLLGRDPATGQWGWPAFYSVGGGSLGLQLGVQTAEIVMIIRTDAGLKAVIDDQFKMGGDAGVSFGNVGGGVGGSTTTNLGADIVTLSQASGLFGGATIGGAALVARNDLNAEFYGDVAADPVTIVLDNRFANPLADPLRLMLARFAQ